MGDTRTNAVVLLSGGLDSATVLAMARDAGHGSITALVFEYGQRHSVELLAARRVAESQGVSDVRTVPLDFVRVWDSASNALTGDVEVPKDRTGSEIEGGVPSTYVPARNLVFLSIGTALCEVVGARHLYIGVNQLDYSGYPDCRSEFIRAFQQAAALATRAGTESDAGVCVRTPLIDMTKAEIIRIGSDLGVDYALTHSCYDPIGELACGRCDSCVLRRAGFGEAGVPDPTRYA